MVIRVHRGELVVLYIVWQYSKYMNLGPWTPLGVLWSIATTVPYQRNEPRCLPHILKQYIVSLQSLYMPSHMHAIILAVHKYQSSDLEKSS